MVDENKNIIQKELDECLHDLKTERSQLVYVGWIIGFVTVLLVTTFWLAPNAFHRDPESLLRYTLLTVPMVLFNVCLLLLSLVLLDFIVPGKALRKIGEDSFSSAILFGCLLLAIGIAMVAGGS